MGNLMEPTEEKAAINELLGLSPETKRWLSHHIRNSICPVIAVCGNGDVPLEEQEIFADECHVHLDNDLKKIGC